MSAIDCLERISNTSLMLSDLQYCLLDSNKLPFQINGEPARSNDNSTFVSYEKLLSCNNLDYYTGVAISVQASNVCAVDIDHCLLKPNNFTTMSDLAKDVVNMFKEFGYVESSFSGLGIRILFNQACIKDYKQNYYLKNSKLGLEYYQFDQPGRYVSVTGNYFINNGLDCKSDHTDIIKAFLEKYMKRPFKVLSNTNSSFEKDSRSIDLLMNKVKYKYLTDTAFQDLWFDPAPGHGSNESERDYH